MATETPAVERYDYRTVTRDVAKEFGRIFTDAFSEDVLKRGLWPAGSQFSADALPPIAEYEQLLARAQQFRRIVEVTARSMHLQLLRDPRRQLFMLREPQGRYVAGAFWVLPKYLPQPRPSLLHRLRTWLLARWYALLDWWTLLGQQNPFRDNELADVLARGRRELGADDTPERREELHSLNPKQLMETTYPRDYTYYLSLLAARRSAQGHGYGKRLFKESLRALGPYQRPPHFIGPAKSSVLAAPTARGFYLQMGYSVGATSEHVLPNGEWAPFMYCFLNLRTRNAGGQPANPPRAPTRQGVEPGTA